MEHTKKRFILFLKWASEQPTTTVYLILASILWKLGLKDENTKLYFPKNI